MSRCEPCILWIVHRFTQQVVDDSWSPEVLFNPANVEWWKSLQCTGLRCLPTQAFMSRCECGVLFVAGCVTEGPDWTVSVKTAPGSDLLQDWAVKKKNSVKSSELLQKVLFIKLKMRKHAQLERKDWAARVCSIAFSQNAYNRLNIPYVHTTSWNKQLFCF